MKKILASLSCFMLVFSLLIPAATAKTSQKEQFLHPETQSEKAQKGMIKRMIAQMTDREKIGQLVMPSTFDDGSGMPNEFTKQAIQEYKAGSVIVYGKRTADHQAAYNNKLQEWAEETEKAIPLIISADLEYGASQRVPQDATTFPRQMGIGATDSLEYAELVSSITGKEARAMGFNWNYSPVADVNTNPKNPVIGVRSFGEDTDLVADMTAAQVIGNQKEGVMASAKHFPGHGDTSVDSHYGLAQVTYDRDTLDEVHLPPFQAAIDAGTDSIMTAHVIIDAIDPELPATLSKKVLTDLLRDEMGFDGLIVTDAMSMKAIDDNWGAGNAAVLAINAGADIIMATGNQEDQLETFNALYEAYQTGEITRQRVHEALERILAKKFKYNLFEERTVDPEDAVEITQTPAHKEAASDIAINSMTLLKNDGVLPFDNQSQETTLVAGTTYINQIGEKVREKSEGDVSTWSSSSADPSESEIGQAVELAEDADRIIVPTYSASVLPEGQVNLVQALRETGKPVAVVSLGLPYDIKEIPEVDAYLASYALDRWGTANPTAWTGAVDVIFGENPGGKLPVNIEGLFPMGSGLSYE
ncbi:beta-N-acetylhexosaminidase [Thalassobacillus devorans]|uniref:Beta-N-acetylhexosaminidase n=1 Tax=Thalassobacillus devorans TaxID=279813 RepID=A0ABQ1PDJ1_9BACI|nr:glycoside hydrolase family 3 protein [Thalassobacillus devorans]NIK29235.1 beta-N-acetylhexosaminidase [Thalassobacillus devorans]GGC95130.1 beta-N-acetylhexosaminidase [Thalassobacillus devorans]